MKKLLYIVSLVYLGISANLFAADRTAEVEALVNKAYTFCKTEGFDKCIKTFNDKDPRFTKGDLYIFVSEFSGVALAHGGNALLVGKDLSKVKSPSGIYPGIEMAKIAKEKGTGWLDYRWSHPVTKKVANKSTYVKRFEGKDLFVASGYYK